MYINDRSAGALPTPTLQFPEPETKQQQIAALGAERVAAQKALTAKLASLSLVSADLDKFEKSPAASTWFGKEIISEFETELSQDRSNAHKAYNATSNTVQLKLDILDGNTELYSTAGPALNEPSLDDINQGQYGDCYFLAALGAVVKKDPQAIENMIHDNGDGTYTVTLYQASGGWPGSAGSYQPVKVTINPADIPYDAADEPGYTGGTNAEITDPNNGKQILWVSVVEAAYAKIHGIDGALQSGYNAIGGGGWSAEPMETLTGEAAANDFTNSMQGVWAEADLEKDFNAGDLIAIGTDHSGKLPYGLVNRHFYTVTDVYTRRGVEYVALYNPWGSDPPQDVPVSALSSVSNDISVGTMKDS